MILQGRNQEDFNEEVAQYLSELANGLRNGTYRATHFDITQKTSRANIDGFSLRHIPSSERHLGLDFIDLS